MFTLRSLTPISPIVDLSNLAMRFRLKHGKFVIIIKKPNH